MLTTDVSQAELMTSQDLTTTGYNISTLGYSSKQGCPLPLAFNIIVNVILLSFICILGLIGNTLSVIVLHRERGNRVAVLLLQSLAVADNACLTLSLIFAPFILGILPSLSDYSNTVFTVAVYFQKYITPVAHMAQTGTIWTVVLIAANRYFAICRPFQAQSCLTLTRTKIQLAFVVTFSLIFNLPRFFQTRVTTNASTGHTEIQATVIGPESKFGEIYSHAVYTMLVLVLPFGLLVILNVRLIFALRASRKRMRRNSVNRPEANANNITLVMIIIIVVLLCCLLPDRLIPVFIRIFDTSGCFMQGFQCICNLLFVINSSVNFFIYYWFRRRFRNILLTHICGCQTAPNLRNGSLNSNPILQLQSREYTQNVHFSGSQRSNLPCKHNVSLMKRQSKC